LSPAVSMHSLQGSFSAHHREWKLLEKFSFSHAKVWSGVVTPSVILQGWPGIICRDEMVYLLPSLVQHNFTGIVFTACTLSYSHHTTASTPIYTDLSFHMTCLWVCADWVLVSTSWIVVGKMSVPLAGDKNWVELGVVQLFNLNRISMKDTH
jgi:hypothetical protein